MTQKSFNFKSDLCEYKDGFNLNSTFYLNDFVNRTCIHGKTADDTTKYFMRNVSVVQKLLPETINCVVS